MESPTDEMTALRKSIMSGDTKPLRHYLASGGDPDSVNTKGMSILMLAVWAGKESENPRLLLEAGADISFRQPGTGWRAFHFAVVNDHVDILHLLLHHGDAFHAPDDWKALHYAVQYRAYRTLSVLVERGIDIELRDDEGRTPLMRSARTGIARMITFLLEAGADPCAKDPDGRSPYDHALDAGKKNAALLLHIQTEGPTPPPFT